MISSHSLTPSLVPGLSRIVRVHEVTLDPLKLAAGQNELLGVKTRGSGRSHALWWILTHELNTKKKNVWAKKKSKRAFSSFFDDKTIKEKKNKIWTFYLKMSCLKWRPEEVEEAMHYDVPLHTTAKKKNV